MDRICPALVREEKVNERLINHALKQRKEHQEQRNIKNMEEKWESLISHVDNVYCQSFGHRTGCKHFKNKECMYWEDLRITKQKEQQK
jgi:hypothetical protein